MDDKQDAVAHETLHDMARRIVASRERRKEGIASAYDSHHEALARAVQDLAAQCERWEDSCGLQGSRASTAEQERDAARAKVEALHVWVAEAKVKDAERERELTAARAQIDRDRAEVEALRGALIAALRAAIVDMSAAEELAVTAGESDDAAAFVCRRRAYREQLRAALGEEGK